MFFRQSKNRGQKLLLCFSFLKAFLKECIKHDENFPFFHCACVVGGLFEASPSGWRPPSLLSCDAGDETWLTNFNKQVPAVGRRGEGESVLKSAIYSVFCIQPAQPGLIRQDFARSQRADKTLPVLPLLLRCCSQTFMLLPDDISFPAGINNLKQSPLH